MSRSQPHLLLSYEDRVPAPVFSEFIELVSAEGLDLAIEERKTPGPFAGIEWLIPPAAILFVTQGYFNAILGELGKDHYKLFKEGVKGLRERFNLVKLTVIGTPGKVSDHQPYSLLYSIYFECDGGTTFKFLIPSADWETELADQAMEAFFDFLEAYYAGSLDELHAERLAAAPDFGRLVLVAYDPNSRQILPIHPITRQF